MFRKLIRLVTAFPHDDRGKKLKIITGFLWQYAMKIYFLRSMIGFCYKEPIQLNIFRGFYVVKMTV